MKNVLSVRLNDESLKRVRELATRDKKEISMMMRELIDQGLVLLALREYREGKLSLGSLAKCLGVSLAEAIDLLADLGVRSPIEYDEYLQSLQTASRILRDSR
jgi:predicted transcriptional regulator